VGPKGYPLVNLLRKFWRETASLGGALFSIRDTLGFIKELFCALVQPFARQVVASAIAING